MENREIAKLVCNALDDKKAIDVKVIDIANVSVIADYFIIASASNQNQLLALQDEAERIMTINGLNALSVEGNRSSTWILLDYGDIIVHLFTEQDRAFYDLERIWKDGIEIPVEEL